MTKQEEIREGMRSHLKRLYTRCFGKEPEGTALDYIEHCLTNQEIWLTSQGAVLKVEGELPEPDLSSVRLHCFTEGGSFVRADVRAKRAIEDYGNRIKKAGYVAVEPLIGETNGD